MSDRMTVFFEIQLERVKVARDLSFARAKGPEDTMLALENYASGLDDLTEKYLKALRTDERSEKMKMGKINGRI